MTTSKDFIEKINTYLKNNSGSYAADILFGRNYEIFMDFVKSCDQAFDLPDHEAIQYDYYEVINWTNTSLNQVGHEVRVALRFAKVVYSHTK